MLRILLCCGGGFSSSAIATRMQKQIEENGLGDQYSIEFYPLEMAGLKYAKEKFEDYDVIMCCPHLKMVVKRMMDSDIEYDKPIYLLPPKMYGLMKLEEIIPDLEDVVEMYKKDHMNPVIFPGEENLLRVTRGVAYRHLKK